MQPILVHRGEFVAQRLIKVFNNCFIALHVLLLVAGVTGLPESSDISLLIRGAGQCQERPVSARILVAVRQHLVANRNQQILQPERGGLDQCQG
jgi:hypothetical protein